MKIADRYNPKKWIGSLGRRYGGKPFLALRKFYYGTIGLGVQFYETYYLRKGRYAPGHRDTFFYEKYYGKADSEKRGPTETTGFKRGIVCMCDGRRFHGGVTDRLRGILTTYREAKKRRLPFYIHWNSPFELEDYLVPNIVDWRISDEELSYRKGEAFPVIVEDETNFESRMRMNAGFRLKYPQLHLYSNADNSRGSYRKLYGELFQPSEALAAETKKHLDLIGTRFWSFSFRFLGLLGDFRDRSRLLSDEEAEGLIAKVKREMLKEMEKLPEGYRALVTADSQRFLRSVEGIDSRIYIVPGDIQHIDKLKGEHPDIWMKTFTDQQLLMHSERVYLMRTGEMYKSGFARFAAEVGGGLFIDHKFK